MDNGLFSPKLISLSWIYFNFLEKCDKCLVSTPTPSNLYSTYHSLPKGKFIKVPNVHVNNITQPNVDNYTRFLSIYWLVC